MRFVIANALLFVTYTGVAMMEIWLTFQYKDWDPFNGKSEVIVTGSPWWPLSAVLAACIVNCWLVRLRNPAQRILLGIGLGLLACAVAVVPYFTVTTHFFFWTVFSPTSA